MFIPLTLAALAATALPTLVPAPGPGAPPGPMPVALSSPTRLVQTADDLYWTRGTTVYRTSKHAHPGQETVIYRESGAGRNFGALAHADGIYLVVNEHGRSRIKRLSDGAVLAASTGPVGVRDLVTNGRLLFWPDAGGVRAVSVHGGPLLTVAGGQGIHHLAFADGDLYYAQGKRIHRIGLDGPALFTTADRAVTALAARGGVVYYGSADGSVTSKAEGRPPVVLQPPTVGRTTSSIFTDGRRVLWSDCATTATSCAVRTRLAGHTWSFRTGPRTHDVVADAHATFFGDTAGVERFGR